jgi:hypothetical protein
MESVEKIGCNTLVRIEPDGTKVFKDKKKFNTLEEAIEECKKLNALPHRISKIVSYKCKHCCKYHTGRNGKIISSDYKDKLNSELDDKQKEEARKATMREVSISRRKDFDEAVKNANFKIVGKIDLSKIPKK